TTPDITGTWAEIFPLLLGPESKKAAQEIKSLGIPAPDEIGFELTNSNGEVIAEAEMAWIEMKTVFLIPEQMSFAQIFTNNDWIVLTSESPITLNSFQGRIL
ncbi:MAG: hypothetical protein LBF22_12470, partial [Deltaproteobacteria bacterium]|nr:hypothetical protein [Deltaproteobacteria bacterium]